MTSLSHQFFSSSVRPLSGGDLANTRVTDAKGDVVHKNQSRPGRSREADVCHCCRKVGHWKDKCPLLKSKGRASPAMLCVDVPQGKVEAAVVPASHSGFEPFITTARVSLAGSSESANITVLRDMGAMHSFIVESVLPFSSGSQVNDFILMRGMELGCLPVPRYSVALECDFVSGVFPVAVSPALRVEGVDMILGNDICGGNVFVSDLPSPVVVSKPVTSDLVSDIDNEFFFGMCCYTRSG